MICSSPILYLMKYFPSKRFFLRLSLVLLNKVSFKLQKSKNFLFSLHAYLTLFIKWLFVYKGLKHCPGHWPSSSLRDLSQNQATLFFYQLFHSYFLSKNPHQFLIEFLSEQIIWSFSTSAPPTTPWRRCHYIARVRLSSTPVG